MVSRLAVSVKLGRLVSSGKPYDVVAIPNFSFQLPGSALRVVQNSTTLKNPLNTNSAAVEMVAGKGSGVSEEVQKAMVQIGRTSTV
jgi:hypothetical protein